MQSRDELSRLKRIETQLSQLKVIMLIVLVCLLFGVFAPKEWVAPVGMGILGFGIVGTGLYCVLMILDLILKKRFGNTEERLEQELLQKMQSTCDRDASSSEGESTISNSE